MLENKHCMKRKNKQKEIIVFTVLALLVAGASIIGFVKGFGNDPCDIGQYEVDKMCN